jgi:hypothetical protein
MTKTQDIIYRLVKCLECAHADATQAGGGELRLHTPQSCWSCKAVEDGKRWLQQEREGV